ncbi:hypothetical protein EJ03DRAFT_380919 [Teratosphaeria nubilosa]|uniref:Uncharacterized protein n=1 Tax=Teratosphaeria nubilosa TaxID=161662 RepID=A0A6G1LI93_9PEZI|nr:hypothetical protein EJ03DRAFT_380919 [Teratosphaeria nubilosa]
MDANGQPFEPAVTKYASNSSAETVAMCIRLPYYYQSISESLRPFAKTITLKMGWTYRRVLSLEKALGFRYARGISLQRPAKKLLPPPVWELEQRVDEIKHRYVKERDLCERDMDQDEDLATEIKNLFHTLGPQLWLDDRNSAMAPWLVDAGEDDLDGHYPRSLFYNSAADNEFMLTEFHDMVVAKCSRFRMNQHVKIRKSGDYPRKRRRNCIHDSEAYCLVTDIWDSDSPLSSLETDYDSDDQTRRPPINIERREGTDAPSKRSSNQADLEHEKRDSLIVRLAISGEQQLLLQAAKESATQAQYSDNQTKTSVLAATAPAVPQSTRVMFNECRLVHSSLQAHDSAISDEAPEMLDSRGTEADQTPGQVSTQYSATGHTTSAAQADANGPSTNDNPTRSHASSDDTIAVSMPQKQPAPTASMGGVDAVPTSNAPTEDITPQVPARRTPGTEHVNSASATNKRKRSDTAAASRAARARTHSPKQEPKVKIECIEISDDDDEPRGKIDPEFNGDQDVAQNAMHSVNDHGTTQVTPSLPGPPTPAPSLAQVPQAGSNAPLLAPERQAAHSLDDETEDEADLELELREVRLERRLRRKKAAKRRAEQAMTAAM